MYGFSLNKMNLDAKRARAKAQTEAEMGKKLPTFDAQLHGEVVDIYLKLPPAIFVEQSKSFLTSPTPADRLKASGAIRALGNSEAINFVLPGAVTSARLYYLVAFLEGMVMPQLQVLISCCTERGAITAGKNGVEELKRARANLGPALSFLDGVGATALASAPMLQREIRWANSDRIAQFRNSIAHFRFVLDEATISADKADHLRALGTARRALALGAMKGVAKILRLPPLDLSRIPDYAQSSVRYEEDLRLPVQQTSRRRSYGNIRDTLVRVEQLGITMLFAALTTATIHQGEGTLRLAICAACKQGTMFGLPGGKDVCPVCSATHTF